MLSSGGIETGPKLVLVSRPRSYYNNRDVCGFGSRYGFCETGLVVGPAFTSLCISDGLRRLANDRSG
jgi:hypothetical protein